IIQTCYVAPRPVEASNETDLNRVYARTENDRYGCGRGFGSERSLRAARRGNYGNTPINQIGDQLWQFIQCIIGSSVLDRDVLVRKITFLAQPFLERSE